MTIVNLSASGDRTKQGLLLYRVQVGRVSRDHIIMWHVDYVQWVVFLYIFDTFTMHTLYSSQQGDVGASNVKEHRNLWARNPLCIIKVYIRLRAIFGTKVYEYRHVSSLSYYLTAVSSIWSNDLSYDMLVESDSLWQWLCSLMWAFRLYELCCIYCVTDV